MSNEEHRRWGAAHVAAWSGRRGASSGPGLSAGCILRTSSLLREAEWRSLPSHPGGFNEALEDETTRELVGRLNLMDAAWRGDPRALNGLDFARFDAEVGQHAPALIPPDRSGLPNADMSLPVAAGPPPG